MYTRIPPAGSADDTSGGRPQWGHAGAGQAVIDLRIAGAVLRTARAYAGLSQRELAARVGISFATVTRIEGNRATPRWSTVERCVRACGFRIALINDDGEVIDHAPLVPDRDRAGRHYPAHLNVRRVSRSEDWWNGGGRQPRFVPLDECPPYTFSRYRTMPEASQHLDSNP